MLTEIRLTNFKCFRKKTTFPLSKINLLTGINGRGKSSLLQALLLMKQSVEHNEYTNEIILNGNCVNLGRFEDIRNSNHLPLTVEFIYFDFVKKEASYIGCVLEKQKQNDNLLLGELILYFKNEQTHYKDVLKFVEEKNYNSQFFLKHIDDENQALLTYYPEDEPNHSIGVGFAQDLTLKYLVPDIDTEIKFVHEHYADLINKRYNLNLPVYLYDFDNIHYHTFNIMHYIPADRLGSQNIYEKISLEKFISVTKKGENIPSILSFLKKSEVSEELILENTESQLLKQTSAWLTKIFDTEIDIIINDSYRSAIEMLFEIDGKEFLPTNVGFGYSYILPIIVSGLIAKKDEILIIENPEAHLHPKAQHELTKFLTKVASCGIQILLESHSEHILNALRITAIDKPENPKILEKEDVNILYFDNSEKHFQQIKIMEDNDLSAWLPDFFDQTNKDYNTIYDY